jgi:hypothetical protein
MTKMLNFHFVLLPFNFLLLRKPSVQLNVYIISIPLRRIQEQRLDWKECVNETHQPEK